MNRKPIHPGMTLTMLFPPLARRPLGFSAMLLGCLVCLATCGASAADPAPRGPTEVLARFVGDWHTTATIRRPGPPPREIVTKGRASCRATLGGNWFEFRTETVPPGESDLQVMSYDAGAKVYRQWVFSSDGYHHEATGQWNAATNTMTWSGRTADGSFVITDHWATPDRLEWTLKRTNAQDQVVQTIEGVVTRAEQQ